MIKIFTLKVNSFCLLFKTNVIVRQYVWLDCETWSTAERKPIQTETTLFKLQCHVSDR